MYKTFQTTQTDLMKYNGQRVEVVKVVNKGEGNSDYDDECLPMIKIKFSDGVISDAYTDELS